MISRSYNKNITFISKRGKPMYEKCFSKTIATIATLQVNQLVFRYLSVATRAFSIITYCHTRTKNGGFSAKKQRMQRRRKNPDKRSRRRLTLPVCLRTGKDTLPVAGTGSHQTRKAIIGIQLHAYAGCLSLL